MSRFVRWGWLGVAINAVFVLANVACLMWLNGGPLNWTAIIICTASGIFCFWTWRKAVRTEVEHRQWLADFDARLERLRGDFR